MVNANSRAIDGQRRDDRRAGMCEVVEVVDVHPHVTPDDQYFNTVDVQLIDRILPCKGNLKLVIHKDVNVMQQYHGKYQGDIWTPRIGEMVYLFWVYDDEGVIIGSRTSVEEPPVCRSKANCLDQEFVRKRSPHQTPAQNAEGNFTEFPLPRHPECNKL